MKRLLALAALLAAWPAHALLRREIRRAAERGAEELDSLTQEEAGEACRSVLDS
jgi:hypothetical protein